MKLLPRSSSLWTLFFYEREVTNEVVYASVGAGARHHSIYSFPSDRSLNLPHEHGDIYA